MLTRVFMLCVFIVAAIRKLQTDLVSLKPKIREVRCVCVCVCVCVWIWSISVGGYLGVCDRVFKYVALCVYVLRVLVMAGACLIRLA